MIFWFIMCAVLVVMHLWVLGPESYAEPEAITVSVIMFVLITLGCLAYELMEGMG